MKEIILQTKYHLLSEFSNYFNEVQKSDFRNVKIVYSTKEKEIYIYDIATLFKFV